MVTENFADYARIVEQWRARGEACVPVVFVGKSALRPGAALAPHLA